MNKAEKTIEQKKTTPFKSLLSRPKKKEIHTRSIKLFYECIMMISARYTADYFKKATHTISVDQNVKEIVIGGATVDVSTKTGIGKILSKGMRMRKNKVQLDLEEHVFIDNVDKIILDYNGTEMKLPFKMNAKMHESYPDKLLSEYEKHLRSPRFTHDEAVKRLRSKLQQLPKGEMRDLNEEFTVQEIIEIYVPIFEARLTCPRRKVGIIRVDGIRNKVV